MKYPTLIGLLMLCISCTQKSPKKISHPDDYAHYITPDEVQPTLVSLDSEIVFWENKLRNQPNGFLYQQKLGAALAAQFEKTGDINYIHRSSSFLNKATDRTAGKNKASTLLSLSSNAIKLHQFKEAYDYAFQAGDHTPEQFGPKMMQFDAMMEIGMYEDAVYTLRSTQRQESFAYMVRYAKYKDHVGQLDSAIYYMEAALDKIHTGDEKNWLWTMASLGDYYGHSGDIQKSYTTFLEVLERDPNYRHALQGIAWIAYSHDRDPESAMAIYNYLNNLTDMPDQLNAMAEVYEFQGDLKTAKQLTEEFVLLAEASKYGDMYNAYLIDYYVNHDIAKAITLAQKEITNRPTPQSYSSLAWSHYHDGKINKAMDILEKHVIDKTYEPGTLRKAAVISAAAGKRAIASKLLEDISDARFELGPLAIME